MIIVLGHIDIDPADVEAFRRDIETIDPRRVPDGGCLSYDVALLDPEAGRLLVAERWRDQQSLERHLNRDRTVAFGQRWGARMRSGVLKYDAANERPLMA